MPVDFFKSFISECVRMRIGSVAYRLLLMLLLLMLSFYCWCYCAVARVEFGYCCDKADCRRLLLLWFRVFRPPTPPLLAAVVLRLSFESMKACINYWLLDFWSFGWLFKLLFPLVVVLPRYLESTRRPLRFIEPYKFPFDVLNVVVYYYCWKLLFAAVAIENYCFPTPPTTCLGN